jgi:hypothetical protein
MTTSDLIPEGVTAAPAPLLIPNSDSKLLKAAGTSLFVVLWLAPAIFIAWFLWRYAVDVPIWDDLGPGTTLHDSLAHGLTWKALMAQHSEARIFFPRLIYQVLDLNTHWDVRYHMYVSYLMIFCTGLVLIRLCLRTIDNRSIALAAAVFMNLMLFSPVQWDNFLWGIMLVSFVPGLMLVIAIYCLGSELELWVSAPIAAAATIVAVYSNACGILLWVLPIPYFFMQPTRFRRWIIGAWLALAAICTGYYFHGYERPPGHPPISEMLHNPLLAVKFLLAFIGNGVRQNWDFEADVKLGLIPTVAWLVGVLYVAVIGRSRLLWRNALPWVILGAYTFGNGALTTLGRYGFGPLAAIAERYPTYVIPLWFSIIPLWIVIFRHSIRKNSWLLQVSMLLPAAGAMAVLFLMVKGCLFIRGEVLVYNARCLAGRTAAQFALVAPDDDALKVTVAPDPVWARWLIGEMDRADLFHPGCFRTSDISTIAAVNEPGTAGFFEYIGVQGDQLVLAGWACIPPLKGNADSVLLTTPDPVGVERVVAIVNDDRLQRLDVAKIKHHQQLDRSGWSKAFDLNRFPHGTLITAWAYDSYGRRAYQLAWSQRVP